MIRHTFPQLPFFLATLSLFHFLEYWITARHNTSRAKVGAFILTNNGSQYHIAHSCAIIEALVEYFFFPHLKQVTWITYVGLGLVVLGQTARSVAMWHAGGNFSHYVATRKEREHRLVKEGVYSVLRHPSYTGYWWWAVGTQIMLGNVVCALGFAAVLIVFFRRRIEDEEMLLGRFFGDEYKEYRQKSWVLIPGVWGKSD